MPKKISDRQEKMEQEDADHERFLGDCYAEGLKFADSFGQFWTLFGCRCAELLPDKKAVQAFSEPVGWSGLAWAKAARRFPDWFNGDVAQFHPELMDETKHAPTAWQLMTLAKFATVSRKKSTVLYDEWIKDGCNWPPDKVEDAVDDCRGREGCGSSLKVAADVKFDKQGKMILAAPQDQMDWTRGNGVYIVRLRKKRK